jgi:hypothetical protein
MLPGYSGIPPVRHATPVAELHDDVAQTPRATPAVALVSATPNASPATVTELAPDSGKLSITAEAIAASKLKPGPDVPATPPTLTADSPKNALIELLWHDSVVADVQDDVMHATIASALVAVSSPAPKSSPETVTDVYPLCGAFS